RRAAQPPRRSLLRQRAQRRGSAGGPTAHPDPRRGPPAPPAGRCVAGLHGAPGRMDRATRRAPGRRRPRGRRLPLVGAPLRRAVGSGGPRRLDGPAAGSHLRSPRARRARGPPAVRRAQGLPRRARRWARSRRAFVQALRPTPLRRRDLVLPERVPAHPPAGQLRLPPRRAAGNPGVLPAVPIRDRLPRSPRLLRRTTMRIALWTCLAFLLAPLA